MTSQSRARTAVGSSVVALPSATLGDVIEQVALNARAERKYLVPADRFAQLIARLPERYAVLEINRQRGFAYESVYFDTPDLLTYRQHLQERRRRYKVRTRTYLDSADCAFEVKLKWLRDQAIKARLPYSLADRARVTPAAQAFLGSQLQHAYGQPAPELGATATTSYRRTTLVDLECSTRLTCDVDLTCTGGGRIAVGLSQYVLVESKSLGPNSVADTVLRGLGLRPVQMSKYCVAVALLYPGVRSNPWHRTLRRYFADPVHGREFVEIVERIVDWDLAHTCERLVRTGGLADYLRSTRSPLTARSQSRQ
jgi:VTC domain